MSKRLEGLDFSRERDYLMRSTTPVPYRAQQAWLDDWKVAGDKMHYLDIQKAEISDSLRTLIQVVGKLRRPNLNLDLVKPDVENLWTGMAARAEDAAHCFKDTDTGFECSFYAIVERSYVTGSVVVKRYS